MIAIIDYDAGNLASVERAVRSLGQDCRVTRDLKEIAQADRVIFPGVGAAGSAMESLKNYKLDQAIKDFFQSGKPLLGICLGTQIILGHSLENDTDCLGLIPGQVEKFDPTVKSKAGDRLKVPQMGWNNVEVRVKHPVLETIRPDHQFYFVHGYYPSPEREEHILATTEYGVTYASVLGRDNLVATQFHPEKSGEPGLAILDRFCGWNP